VEGGKVVSLKDTSLLLQGGAQVSADISTVEGLGSFVRETAQKVGIVLRYEPVAGLWGASINEVGTT
jgi:hypothetical protein